MTEAKSRFQLPYYSPSDNTAYLLRYRGTKGGVCGPACLATLGQTTIGDVLSRWLGKGPSAFRGFTPISEIKEMLQQEGWQFKYLRGGKSKQFPVPKTDQAIIRIQWLQPDGTEYYWRAAGAHTHYVLMLKDKGIWFVLCNEQGWFVAHGPIAENYLKLGFVSSILELSRLHAEPRTGKE